MATITQPTTASELLSLRSQGRRHELVHGELREMSPAGSTHGSVAMRMAASLFQHVELHGLGRVFAAETGFLIARNPDTVRAPDVAFVRAERLLAEGETDGYWPGAPDLAAEVVSPSDHYTDVEEKVLQWLGAGCRMVIVVNPRQRVATVHYSRVEVLRLTDADALDGRDIAPGWRLPLRKVFG